MAASRLQGITPTIRLMCRIGKLIPLVNGNLGTYSKSIDKLLDRFPFLFIAGKQRCLVRGLLLYFFGKRHQMDIRLQFGSKQVNNGFDTHCWIKLNRQVQFEVEDVIKQYMVLVEYK